MLRNAEHACHWHLKYIYFTSFDIVNIERNTGEIIAVWSVIDPSVMKEALDQ
jgi:hypothetical protein